METQKTTVSLLDTDQVSVDATQESVMYKILQAQFGAIQGPPSGKYIKQCAKQISFLSNASELKAMCRLRQLAYPKRIQGAKPVKFLPSITGVSQLIFIFMIVLIVLGNRWW